MSHRVVRHVLLCGGLVLLLWGAFGCSGDESCEDGSTECGYYTICCTETQCYYEIDDGTRFECDGTDCEAAAVELAEYQCAGLKDEAPETFARLVEEILAAADEQVITVSTGQYSQ